MNAKTAKMGPARVGVVGLGRCAKLLARAAAKSDKLRIIAAYSRSEQKRRTFQLETRVPVVSDLRTLLSYPMLDGVIVSVPDDQHLPVACEVAKAKKHIYIENPIARNLEEGLEIAALEQKYGITVTVGYSARFLAGIQRIREAIDAGELGRVTLIEANFSSPEGLRQNSGGSNATLSKAPGGPLTQLAAQQFDVLQYLGSDIAEISAMASQLSQAETDADDHSTALLRFVDGKLGYVGSSWTAPGVFGVRVFGSKALMHYEADLGAWEAAENPSESSMLYIQRGKDGYAKREELQLGESETFRTALEIFARTCRTGKSTELTAASANRVMTIVAAALHSAANRGQSVRIADVLARARSQAPEAVRA